MILIYFYDLIKKISYVTIIEVNGSASGLANSFKHSIFFLPQKIIISVPKTWNISIIIQNISRNIIIQRAFIIIYHILYFIHMDL